jgi:hypothetical protein
VIGEAARIKLGDIAGQRCPPISMSVGAAALSLARTARSVDCGVDAVSPP